MWNDGKTTYEIGGHFGISHQRVCQILAEEGHEGGHGRLERRATTAKKMRAKGASLEEIAEALDVSRLTVKGYIYKPKYKDFS